MKKLLSLALSSALLLALVVFDVPASFGANPPPDVTKAGVGDRAYSAAEQSVDKNVPLVEEQPVAEEEAAGMPAGQKFQVKGFVFQGNTVFDAAQLDAIAEEYKGQELDMRSLNRVCAEISRYYRTQGFIMVRAFIPEQEVKDGIVQIQIREIPIGKITLEGNKYYSENFILNHFKGMEGKPVNYDKLLKQLLLINEYTNLQVRSFFARGTEEWTTDLNLKVEDKRPMKLMVDYNNYGSSYISRSRERISMDYGDVFLGGDQISATVMAGIPLDALNYYFLQYRVPVNSYDTKVGAFYNYSNFVVGKEFEDLDVEGDLQDFGFDVTHPLLRSRRTNMDLAARFDFKTSKNYMLDTRTSKDELRILTLVSDFDVVDNWGGRNFFNVQVSQGFPGFLDGSEKDNPESSRLGAGGEFTRGNLNCTRLQKAPFSSLLVLRANGQLSSDVLPASEEMAIGGFDTVRGFPQAKYLGDYGYNLSAEWRFAPPFIYDANVPFFNMTLEQFMQMNVFIDYGSTSFKSPMEGEDKTRDLTGAGFGLRFQFPHDIKVNCAVGFPIDSTDSDESKAVGYVYVSKQFF